MLRTPALENLGLTQSIEHIVASSCTRTTACWLCHVRACDARGSCLFACARRASIVLSDDFKPRSLFIRILVNIRMSSLCGRNLIASIAMIVEAKTHMNCLHTETQSYVNHRFHSGGKRAFLFPMPSVPAWAPVPAVLQRRGPQSTSHRDDVRCCTWYSQQDVSPYRSTPEGDCTLVRVSLYVQH